MCSLIELLLTYTHGIMYFFIELPFTCQIESTKQI